MPHPRDDRGFTLVELLIYVLLLGMILAAGYGLLANSFRGSNQVLGSADASRDGQTIARTIETSVRNASLVSVNTAGTVLTVRSATGECLAWRVMSGGILEAHLPYGGTGTANVSLPGDGWIRLSDQVRQRTSTTTYFTAQEGGVSVQFTVATARGSSRTAPTLIDTLVVPRLPATGSSRCLT